MVLKDRLILAFLPEKTSNFKTESVLRISVTNLKMERSTDNAAVISKESRS